MSEKVFVPISDIEVYFVRKGIPIEKVKKIELEYLLKPAAVNSSIEYVRWGGSLFDEDGIRFPVAEEFFQFREIGLVIPRFERGSSDSKEDNIVKMMASLFEEEAWDKRYYEKFDGKNSKANDIEALNVFYQLGLINQVKYEPLRKRLSGKSIGRIEQSEPYHGWV